jgi:hypothetical protein
MDQIINVEFLVCVVILYLFDDLDDLAIEVVPLHIIQLAVYLVLEFAHVEQAFIEKFVVFVFVVDL